MFPNIFILGAAKSATTSIADYLRKLQISFYCPTNKEPNYFVFKSGAIDIENLIGPATPQVLRDKLHSWSLPNLRDYKSLYLGAQQPWRIDASVRYLYFHNCANCIRDFCDEFSISPKFIVCLRKPSARAKSHYLMMRYKYGLENLSFNDALEMEEERISKGWDYDWHYLECGSYYKQLDRYIKVFGIENILVIFYENLITNPKHQINKIFKFVQASYYDRVKSLYLTFPHSNITKSPGIIRNEDLENDTLLKLEIFDYQQKTMLMNALPDEKIPW